MRFAFELARRRPRKLLTLITKSNAQKHGMVMWDEIFYEVAKTFPDVTTDKMLVDAATTRMVLKPQTLDVMVATNLHADILSDLAAALSGSLGIAPTANLNPERKYPSMFEPIHGSAFDITGKGIANPIGTFWSGAMLLEHLGEKQAAARLMAAIEARHREACLHARLGRHCEDQGRHGGGVCGDRISRAACIAVRVRIIEPHHRFAASLAQEVEPLLLARSDGVKPGTGFRLFRRPEWLDATQSGP